MSLGQLITCAYSLTQMLTHLPPSGFQFLTSSAAQAVSRALTPLGMHDQEPSYRPPHRGQRPHHQDLVVRGMAWVPAAVGGALDRSRVGASICTFRFPPLLRALDRCSHVLTLSSRFPQLARALDRCRSCIPFSDLRHSELQSPMLVPVSPGFSDQGGFCVSSRPLRSSATWFDTSFHVGSVSSGQLVFFQGTAHFSIPSMGLSLHASPPEMVATRDRDHGRFEDCGLAMRSDIGQSWRSLASRS